MFQKAERKSQFLKLGITGPSGSGKTYSALRLASGMSIPGKIAFIDTENGSASLYSSEFDFDVVSIQAPFAIDKFVTAVKEALKREYQVLVVDSASHFWDGVLDYKNSLDKRGGNSFTNWNTANEHYKLMLRAILFSKIHVIACMRSKMDYVVETNDQGRSVPRKVGLAPIMRDGVEYEFTTVFDLDMHHQAVASKDRTGLFDEQPFRITESTGDQFLQWLNQSKSTAPLDVDQIFETTL